MTGRLVVLHGFTQTHHHGHRLALGLARRLDPTPDVALVDLPGHGLSSGDRTTIADAGRIARLAGRGTYVGYSMGGRFAVAAALEQPELVERLVLIGATAGISDDVDRAERRAADEDRARRLDDIGVDQFVDEWLTAPLFAGLPDDPVGLAHRRRNGAAGLAHSLRTSGTGVQVPLWDRLPEISAPTLVVAGADDHKFTAIGRRLADAVAEGTFASVPDAGHAAHIEAPRATADLIAGWLGGLTVA